MHGMMDLRQSLQGMHTVSIVLRLPIMYISPTCMLWIINLLRNILGNFVGLDRLGEWYKVIKIL